MERCAACGAGLSPDAAWCGQCYARVPAAVGGTATATVPSGVPDRFPGSAPAPTVPDRFPTAPGPAASPTPSAAAPAYRYTRWRKTATTFGPIGRVVCTLALVLPFGFLLAFGLLTIDPFVLGGAAVWGGVIMPWGLRDTWRAGRLPVR